MRTAEPALSTATRATGRFPAGAAVWRDALADSANAVQRRDRKRPTLDS